MRVLEIESGLSVPGSATTVEGAVIDLGERQAPFLPGYSTAIILALRGAANATLQLQGSDAMPDQIAVDTEAVGSTDSSGDASDTLANQYVVPGSVVLTIGTETLTDDGAGVLTGDAESDPATGTVDYVTGAITVAGAATETAFTADYSYVDYGNEWEELAEAIVTSANTGFRFTEVAVLPRFVRAIATTEGTSGAGALGVYLLGN